MFNTNLLRVQTFTFKTSIQTCFIISPSMHDQEEEGEKEREGGVARERERERARDERERERERDSTRERERERERERVENHPTLLLSVCGHSHHSYVTNWQTTQ